MLAKKYFIFALVSTCTCEKYHFSFTICIQLDKNQAKKEKPLLSQRDKTVFDNLLIPINCRFKKCHICKRWSKYSICNWNDNNWSMIKRSLHSRQNVASVLNKFIEIHNRNPVPAFVFEEHLQLPQFIERSHVL